MNGTFKSLLGLALVAFAPAAFAQYSMDLTGVGNGTVADGVYVSPYQGTIQGPGVNFAGYMICDDFNTESYLNTPWSASMTNAGALNGTEKFQSGALFDNVTYTTQQSYDAAAWLANGLLGHLNDQTAQINYAFAIWNIFDGQQNTSAGVLALEQTAFWEATHGYVGSNVSVFTPTPINASQEFLVVNPAPEMNSSSAASGIALLLGGLVVLRGRRRALSETKA